MTAIFMTQQLYLAHAAERYVREELGTKVARPARLAVTSAQDAADGGAAGRLLVSGRFGLRGTRHDPVRA